MCFVKSKVFHWAAGPHMAFAVLLPCICKQVSPSKVGSVRHLWIFIFRPNCSAQSTSALCLTGHDVAKQLFVLCQHIQIG